jgi:3-hydroxyacyl-[acyl-carrier-protein] dehydratase
MKFVLIDRLLELEPGRRAAAVKTFLPEEEIFRDHFPGFAVVPGSLLLEAMGQTCGWLLAGTLEFTRWPLVNMVDNAKFRRLVRPGEEIRIEASIRSMKESDFELTAEASVGAERAAGARFLFHAFSPALAESGGGAFAAWTRRTFESLGGMELLRGGSP